MSTQSLAAFCAAAGASVLLGQWDTEKNAPLTPDDVTYGSHKKVWWTCEKGHSWSAAVRSRTGARPCGCPVCAGRAVMRGANDLPTLRPDLAREWDAEKNAPLTPEQFTAGAEQRVWWKCEKGHSWRAAVRSRARENTGCPYCAGQKTLAGFNDLATLRPNLVAEWDAEKNGTLTPEDVTPSSNRRVWWICRRGHSYCVTVERRGLRGEGCPYCAGRRVLAGFNDLATKKPLVAAQWHPTLNGELTPQQVTAGCHRRVWWQCPEGHVWRAVVHSRTGAHPCGCPVCAGKTGTKRARRYEAIIENSAACRF